MPTGTAGFQKFNDYLSAFIAYTESQAYLTDKIYKRDRTKKRILSYI